MLKKILISIFIFSFSLTFLSASCSCKQAKKEEITLTYWRLFDDEEDFKIPFAKFQNKNKNITIKYVKKDLKNYETELLNALVEDRGPDLFMIRNDWVTKHKNKISTAPNDVITAQDYSKQFASVAYQDFVQDDKIYGVPLSIDSLALFVNKTLFNEARLKEVPKDWNGFIEVSKALTKKQGNTVTQAGISMGSGNNVSAAADILSLLMLQNGTDMVSDDKGSATFQLPTQTTGGEQVYPGKSALDFYTSFARPNKETYCWNNAMPTSIDAFAQSKTAMIFGYSHYIPTIRNKAPELSFSVNPMPQIKGLGEDEFVNYGLYWGEVVSNKSSHQKEAWELLKFLSDKDNLSSYLSASERPSSLASAATAGAGELRAFNQQLSTIESWYKGNDAEKVDQAFIDMIEAMVSKNISIDDAINQAATTVTSILQKTKKDS